MKKRFFALIFIIFIIFSSNLIVNKVYADDLKDNIEEQMQKIDFSELEEYYNSLNFPKDNDNFFSHINGLLNGEYNIEFNSITEYIVKIFFSSLTSLIPIFSVIIVIAILCGILQKIKSQYLSSGIGEMLLFISLLTIILLLASEVIRIWKDTENIIKNLAKLTEIMSPIIIGLMIAGGGNVSASVYKPTVAFLSNGIINIILFAVMPLIAIMLIFSVLSNFSSSIKLEKFSDVASSTIKWIIGLMIAIFSMFLSVQGMTSAMFDGISIKATKFAISNSIPLIGGFLKDGFDLVIAGSIIIKNAVGICSLVALFYSILSPILKIACFSLMLKLVSAIIEPITDARISAFCTSMSKCITYMAVALISVGFMLFITILLITFSASAFV